MANSLSGFFAENAAKTENLKYVASERFIDPETEKPYDQEVWTGKMAGDKKVYGKVIDTGALPNAGLKHIDIAGDSLEQVISFCGYIVQPGGYLCMVPFVVNAFLGGMIPMYISHATKELVVQTGADRTTWSAIAFLEYTCTDR